MPNPTLTIRNFSIAAPQALSSGSTQLARTLLVCFSGLRTAHGYYNSMMAALFQAPLAFFETTPQGRILNRASADQNTLDCDLYFSFGNVRAARPTASFGGVSCSPEGGSLGG